MSNLDEMWTELARYQPYADKHGFGEAWKRMCEERTATAACAAHTAARSRLAVAMAVDSATEAALATDATDATECSQQAIERIREAIALEQEHTC